MQCSLAVQHMLRSHEAALEAGHRELLEKEVIFGDDVERILAEHPPRDIPRSSGENGSATNGSNSAAAEQVTVGAESSSR